MLFDCAATCREDEQLITAEARRTGINTTTHVFDRPLSGPLTAMAGPASSYAR
jgi:hypothetical protein